MIDERAIGERYRAVAGELNERQRRVWAKKAIKITNAQPAAGDLHPDAFHGEWNYVIKPRHGILTFP